MPRPVVTRTLLVLVVLGVSFSLYHGFGSGMASYLLRKSKDELAEGHQEAAVEQLARAHELDPTHPDAPVLLAHYYRDQEPERAVGLLEKAIAAGCRKPRVLELLARLKAESGDPDASLELFRQLADDDSRSVAGPLGMARVAGDAELLQERLGVASDPTHQAPSKRWRGIALLHLEDDFGMTGYGSGAAADSLLAAHRIGVRSVSLRVPGYQPSVHEPTLSWGQPSPGGESDPALLRMIRDAHLLGMRVLLKPHIMLDHITDDEWRGRIRYADPAKLTRWWTDYEGFILHYARIAQEHDVEAYCLGVELRAMVEQAPERWSALIEKVRAVYHGKLTYAANWYHEFQEVPFWSELDFIGVQFFFPVSDQQSPSIEELKEGLAPIITELGDMTFMFGKPVLLTEVGYKSVEGATVEPWQWPSEDTKRDVDLQARAYEAILDSFADQTWFAGMFWWNWLTDPEPPEKFDRAFTPQGKPAEQVLRRHWGE